MAISPLSNPALVTFVSGITSRGRRKRAMDSSGCRPNVRGRFYNVRNGSGCTRSMGGFPKDDPGNADIAKELTNRMNADLLTVFGDAGPGNSARGEATTGQTRFRRPATGLGRYPAECVSFHLEKAVVTRRTPRCPGSQAGATSPVPPWLGPASPTARLFSILMLQFFATGHSICLPLHVKSNKEDSNG